MRRRNASRTSGGSGARVRYAIEAGPTRDASLTDTNLLLKALYFAADKHRDQRRKGAGAIPYINHPIAVAHMLSDVGGITDATTLAAAILHDTVEDTDATPEELERQFGAGVAGIVAEVTDDPTLTRAARKQAQIDHAPRLSKPAMLVKLADKVCNVTDILERPPDWPQWRKDEYVRWAREVVEALRGTNSALESKFDEVADRRE